MIHYGSWLHDGATENVEYYRNAYTDEYALYRGGAYHREEESEQTGDDTHDTTTSATSGEPSSSADLFRLEFAASQWSKLVSNAEGLFTKLMSSNVLPHTEQDQIEQWLCLKQEYEECIASDETASLVGYQEPTRRSLERIEEVTETDEKTDESANRLKLRKNSSASDSSEDENEDEEDEEAGTENPDFLEKLDECMNRLKKDTDMLIERKKYEFGDRNLPIIPICQPPRNAENDYVPIIKPIPIRNRNSRRNSMLPGSEMCAEVLAFNGGFRPCGKKNLEFAGREIALLSPSEAPKTEESPDLLTEALRNTHTPEPIKSMKNLAMKNEAKQTRVQKIQSDLDVAQKRIGELQATIRIKESFIEDMLKNCAVRSSAKERFQRKRHKIEEEYYNTRTQLAQAENASKRNKDSEEKMSHKKEIELYKSMAIHYEKRLMDIEMIKQIAGDSKKKVSELKSSLNSSKKQMEELKRQLKREEERKRQLEEELAEDQEKIRQLEEKYNLTASKLREMQSESEDERVLQILSRSEKDIEGEEKKSLLQVSARISHLDQVLKEKSMNLERMTDTEEKEALRHEIRNLRRTREYLIEEKCGLDEKLQKERTLTTTEERKLLECGETIEAIDAMIEHKNEMICGGKHREECQQSQREKSERMLSQLEKLSEGEMRTLFDKYFWKVIDLKQSSKNLEIQTAELERHVEIQDRRVRHLTNALQQTKLEAERKIVEVQREQQERLHLIFRHIAEETGSSGHERLDRNLELAKCKKENKSLRRRLADVEVLLKPTAKPRSPTPPKIVQREAKQPSQPKTKVTRERNKLIIQQTMDSDKRKK